jgi:signal transduction histidine kinase
MLENKKPLILCVDDDRKNLDLLEALLLPEGYEIVMALDGQASLDIFEKEKIDLVILDVFLPDISGFDVLRKLKAKRWTPVILVTALNDRETMIRGLESGADDFLSKPIQKEELRLRVRNILKIKENQDGIERMAAIKEEFISTVSHELRTPLASIKLAVDVLESEELGKFSEDQKVFVCRIKSNIDRLSRLINDVLDLSKLESGKMKLNLVPIDAVSLVREIAEMQRPVIENKGLQLKVFLEDDLPLLIADRDRLTQVITNLVNNAMKFTETGEIAVSVSCPDSKTMTFSVRDTGIGIKSGNIPLLFEKFKQVGNASQQVGGTGLGLVISKELVERHGGRIWVESEFGKGTVFFFSIPVMKEKRILVVDDDPISRRLLKGILAKNYEIELAEDGFMAARKNALFNPHIIVLDNQMPNMDGVEVCARLKKDIGTKNTKIIILSSFDNDVELQKAREAGADDLMCKPVRAAELLSKINILIRQS